MLDTLRARGTDMDSGERDSLLDCLKCDLKFCQQYEEQVKALGFEPPKKASNVEIMLQGGLHTSDSNYNQSVVTHAQDNQTTHMYSVGQLKKYFQRLIKETVETCRIEALGEDITSPIGNL